ncbi:MAG: hypothetical protein COA69_13095 [Robiginitomaculum sp.]|nr:MAG: hypothetical protein COA69_13095 [Robiginitomaculum sp.]
MVAVIKAWAYILATLLGGCVSLPENGPLVGNIQLKDITWKDTVAKSVWIDTDAACSGKTLILDPDDCWAILYAIKSPYLDILGISSVHGNTTSSTAIKSIQDVFSNTNTSGGSPVELIAHKGANKKYSQISDKKLNEAVMALAQKLTHEKVTIIALGPLTNIALLIDWRPELVANIESIVVVGGQRTTGPLRPIGSILGFRDLNIRKDLEAFKRVLDADIPITLLPFEIAQKLTISPSDLKYLASSDMGARWVAKRSRRWGFFWRLTTDVRGFHPFDLMAVSFTADPSQFNCKPAVGNLIKSHGFSRRVELLVKLKETGNIEYCLDVKKGFKANVLNTLTRQEVTRNLLP